MGPVGPGWAPFTSKTRPRIESDRYPPNRIACRTYGTVTPPYRRPIIVSRTAESVMKNRRCLMLGSQGRPMKKVILFLAAGLAVVGVLFVLAGSRTQTPPLANIPVRTVLPNARPLVWLDERFLLTGVDNKIVKLDSRDSKIVQVVSEPYYPRVGYECFSREGGRFAVTAPEVSGSGTSYQNMVYRWIQDWDQPAHFTEYKALESWNTNPHDCTAVKYKAAASIQEQSGPQLLKAADGRTTIYYRGVQVESPHERVVTIEKDGSAAEVALETTPRWLGNQVQLRSSFDPSSRRYFWYLNTEDFNIASPHWPLKGWWVTPEGKIEDWVILPDGPWVKPFSTLYTLRHFSCGPPCYSNMKIWAGNGQLYISVWGDAIDAAVEGVYRLNARKEAWEKIIAGALDNGLILSPSGCQIGYAAGGRMHIMSVCDKGSTKAARSDSLLEDGLCAGHHPHDPRARVEAPSGGGRPVPGPRHRDIKGARLRHRPPQEPMPQSPEIAYAVAAAAGGRRDRVVRGATPGARPTKRLPG